MVPSLPHLTIEYSANMDARVDMGGLCELVHSTLLDTGSFEIGAIRVRAIRCQYYAVGDRLPENGFIDMSLRMGAGRSQADRKRAGEAVFSAVAERLSELFGTRDFALSLEVREIDPELSWRENAMHARLRGQ